MLLAVDTSTSWIGLALYDGSHVLGEMTWQSRSHHTVELSPGVNELLQRCGVETTELQALGVALATDDGFKRQRGFEITVEGAQALGTGSKQPAFRLHARQQRRTGQRAEAREEVEEHRQEPLHAPPRGAGAVRGVRPGNRRGSAEEVAFHCCGKQKPGRSLRDISGFCYIGPDGMHPVSGQCASTAGFTCLFFSSRFQ